MKLTTLPVFAEADAGAGAATVAAGAGADTVAAGAGADTVAAGAGKDTVDAGAGRSAMNREVSDKQVAGAADYPADWRERMAIGADGKPDPKRLDQLKRITSPVDLGKSWFDAQEKIRSGKPGADEPMPDPTKDEAGAKAWREARGIPDKADGYKLDPKVDKLLTDEDKAVFGNLREFALTKNLPVGAVSAFGEWYASTVAGLRQAQAETDAASAEAFDDAMRKELGNEFKPAMTIAQRYAGEVLGKGMADLMDARLPMSEDIDPKYRGKRLGDLPDFVKSFIELGTAKYGDVSFAGGEATKATESRKAELKNKMDTDFGNWPGSAEQKEYAAILAAEEKASSKRGGAGDTR